MKNLRSLTLVFITIFCFSCDPDDAIVDGTNYSDQPAGEIEVNDVFATEGEEEAPPAEKERGND
ncbi:hypothetical protein C8P64_0145 [Christiangramia gaetbulicola]|uniref:Uncharacterized protein n=1 Tax=Christiangramia gaetbulicola TaxID=703340 RepID=A0A2T6AK31_9FLAO|nr:hypothetical protein [Christiangramia gaetbulicola]PTX44175.1 hypothetical protein C8P64_0145 [Christiangramia gaetbulicola]